MITNNIGKGAIISYVSIFLNITISFFYTPWMLNQIGVSDYGLYNLILSFISYFIIDFGLTSAIARFIAKYRAEGNNRKVENILGLTFNIFILIDTIILLCLVICYFFITNLFSGLTIEELDKLKKLYIIAGTCSILSFVLKPLDGALIAYEYFVPAKLIDVIYKVGSVLLVIITLYLGGNIYHLVLINGSLSFLTSVFRYVYWHKQTGLKINLRFRDKQETKSIFSFSSWTFLIGLAMRFRLSLIPSVLGIFSDSTQITIFSLAMTVEAMIYTLSSALNGLFLPKVSKLVYNENHKSIMELMIKVGRIQLFIVSCVITCFFIFGKVFINLWIGKDFSDVYYIILCLILPYILAITMQIANDRIYAEGKVKYTAKAIFTTATLGLFFSCIVSREYGALGCGICSAFALFITQLWYIYIYKRVLKIDIKEFFKECHIKIFPLIFMLSLIFYFLIQLLFIDTWGKLLSSLAIYLCIYASFSWLFLMNHYEKQLIKSLFFKI